MNQHHLRTCNQTGLGEDGWRCPDPLCKAVNPKNIENCWNCHCPKKVVKDKHGNNHQEPKEKPCQELERQRDFEVIDDLFEKLKVCQENLEENMEKLFAASVAVLERAQTKGLLNENFERQ